MLDEFRAWLNSEVLPIRAQFGFAVEFMYVDNKNSESLVGEDAEDYWMVSPKKSGGQHAGGVDLYVGGAEHAVLHLLYARFWHKVLYDAGVVKNKEPFRKLFHQGMLLYAVNALYASVQKHKRMFTPKEFRGVKLDAMALADVGVSIEGKLLTTQRLARIYKGFQSEPHRVPSIVTGRYPI